MKDYKVKHYSGYPPGTLGWQEGNTMASALEKDLKSLSEDGWIVIQMETHSVKLP